MNDTSNPPAAPHPAALWAVRGLAAIALVGSAALLYASAGSAALPGCGAGAGCDAVLNSAWSHWLGLPVALPAALLYLTVLAMSWQVGPSRSLGQRRLAWMVMLLAAVAVVGAAVWFLIVQRLLIDAWCVYCLAVHGTGVLMALAIWLSAPIGRGGALAPRRAGVAGAAGLLSIAALVLGQWLVPAPGPTVERHALEAQIMADRITVALPDGRDVVVNPADLPRLGPAEADVVALYLFDYTCGFCRMMHGYLEEAIARYDGRFAVLAVAVPLNEDCNPFVTTRPAHATACDLAELAMAVWNVDATKFAAFDAWLFEGDRPPTPEAAREHAAALVGAAALDAALAQGAPAQQIGRNTQFYGLLDRGDGRNVLPKLLVGGLQIEGKPATAADLFEMLEQDAGLKPLQSP